MKPGHPIGQPDLNCLFGAFLLARIMLFFLRGRTISEQPAHTWNTFKVLIHEGLWRLGWRSYSLLSLERYQTE